jgi:hypothetical protein
MPQQIDFQCLPGTTLNAVYTKVTKFDSSKFPQQNGPQKSISAFGVLIPIIADNTGGRFGWIAFGQVIAGVPFYEKPHAINYITQVFKPTEVTATAMRIFLAPGVYMDFSASPFYTILNDIKKIEDIVLPMIAAKIPLGIGGGLPKRIP